MEALKLNRDNLRNRMISLYQNELDEIRMKEVNLHESIEQKEMELSKCSPEQATEEACSAANGLIGTHIYPANECLTRT